MNDFRGYMSVRNDCVVSLPEGITASDFYKATAELGLDINAVKGKSVTKAKPDHYYEKSYVCRQVNVYYMYLVFVKTLVFVFGIVRPGNFAYYVSSPNKGLFTTMP